MLKLKDEFEKCNFGDHRLNRRAKSLAINLSLNPEASIHAACGSSSESKNAYRFLQNRKITPQLLLEPHTQKTVTRISESDEDILILQDTTDLIYTQFPSIKDLGERLKAKGFESGVKGILLHNSLAVTQSGVPLGLVKQTYFTHDDYRQARNTIDINVKGSNKKIPFEKKESYRWVEHFRSTNKLLSHISRKVIHVADRECDIYEFLQEVTESRSHFVVRSKANRITKIEEASAETSTIQRALEKSEIIGSIQVKKDGHFIDCEVRIASLTLKPTQRLLPARSKELKPLNISVVEVKSTENSSNKLHWKLLTNLDCETFEDAIQIINIYKCRWTIECFHRVLKSGFGIEKARLANRSRLENLSSVLSVVSWHIFWLYLFSRELPSISATKIFTSTEIKVLKISAKKLKVTIQNFNFKTAILILARLGGFAGRKGDGLPGMINIWRGWRKLHDRIEFMEGMTLT